MAAPQGDNEQVRYDIIIEAKAAIHAMRDMLKYTHDNTTKMTEFTQQILLDSKRWGISWQQAIGVYKQLNAELSKSKKGTLFGQTGGQDLFKNTETYMASLEKVGRLQQAAGQSAEKMGTQTENGTKKAVRGIDAMRIALGVLISMLVFQVIQAIQNTFSLMIKNLRETELAIYNLINAERRLSEMGVDVTPKGLQETIDSVRELVPILSQIQAEELVSRIATNVAPALKLTNVQIRQLAEATALLYVRNKALGKSFEEVEAQITNAFLTGKVSTGINQLGVKISDQIVKDEALRLGLVKTEEEFNSLTGEMESQIKAAAMLSVVYKNATGDIQSIGEYMETTDAKIEKSKSVWDDLLTTLGTLFGPILGGVIEALTHSMEGWIMILDRVKEPLQSVVATWGAFINVINKTGNVPTGILDVFQLFSSDKFFQEYEKIKEGFEGLDAVADTPTNAIENFQDSLDDFDADKFSQEVEDIHKDMEQAYEDLNEKLAEKQADLDLEYQRKAADAQRDYQRKVQDINRDAEREIANLKDKQREEDIRAEQDYQLKLWELRMRFLMDLEDALHARDARQVIRLMKQYAIDKEALERKKNLDDRNREEDQRNALEDIEIKRRQRLEDAQLEYQQKLQDQQTAKQREQDDLAQWYAREQADIQTNIQRKLEALIAGWIAEQQLTEQNAATVYGILSKYFGPGGMTDALYAYMASQLSSMSAMAQQMSGYSSGGGLSNGGYSPGGGLGLGSAGGSVGGLGSTGSRRPRFAEGGSMLATRPTTVTFGEAGAELAQFTPIGRTGQDVNKMFMGNGMGGGMDGSLIVEMSLSPDLEARVVQASMNGVGNIIAKIRRTKN
jgi:hypothetical protein